MRGGAIGTAMLLLLASAAVAAPVPNRPAPHFAATDTTGSVRTLDGWRGRVAVIAYWATWCAPCRTELALLDARRDALGPRGLEVLAVSEEKLTPARLPAWVRALRMPVAIGDQPGLAGWGPAGGIIPTTYVIDRAGTVRARVRGALTPARLDALLLPLLAERAPATSASGS